MFLFSEGYQHISRGTEIRRFHREFQGGSLIGWYMVEAASSLVRRSLKYFVFSLPTVYGNKTQNCDGKLRNTVTIMVGDYRRGLDW
jgi:hypothetical protein